MWAFGSRPGRVEDLVSPEMQKSNVHSSSNGNSQRQYYERPMSPLRQQQLQQQPNIGRGRNKIKKGIHYTNNTRSSPKHTNNVSLPHRPQSPRENQRNNNLKPKKRFTVAGTTAFLGKTKKALKDYGLQGMNVNETSHGIEVTFEPSLNASSKLPFLPPGVIPTKDFISSSPSNRMKSNHGNRLTSPRRNNQLRKEENRESSAVQDVAINRKQEPVISLQDQIQHRQRVFKSQFAITLLPDLGTDIVIATSASDGTQWRPQGHRIPLCGVKATAKVSYAETLHLLQSAVVVDERSVLQQELLHLNAEMQALQHDRTFLEQTIKILPSTNISIKSADSSTQSRDSTSAGALHWDANTILQDDATEQQLISPSRRIVLQRQRGSCLTIHIRDLRVQEMLVHKCGGKLHHTHLSRLFKNDDSIFTLSPDDCRPKGAASALQHVGLLASDNNLGFFLSRDDGQFQCGGRIPDKLFRRLNLKENCKIGDLHYLSTGPHGCYYAEFQSGECWWGSAVDDPDLYYILQSWDVHRVAFGAVDFFDDGSTEYRQQSKVSCANTWIVLGKDGRAAWKNLPASLSQMLECRMTSRCAPVEVSLGPGGSFFVRFFDGTIDYCLPAKLARVCDRIEKRGGVITNVCLQPMISQDFIIRHTELTIPR